MSSIPAFTEHETWQTTLMWFYVLIFALLVGANFADRYSLDRMARRGRPAR